MKPENESEKRKEKKTEKPKNKWESDFYFILKS